MSEGRSWYPFAGETRTFPPLGLRPSILAREAGITVKVEPASTNAFGVYAFSRVGSRYRHFYLNVTHTEP